MHIPHHNGQNPPGGCYGQWMGAGAAVGDYDGDGWPDLFVTDQLETGHLWRNRGIDSQGHWLGFEEKTIEAGIPFISFAAGANFVDEVTRRQVWPGVGI